MLWLITLWAIPIGAFLWARRHALGRLWQITGLAFGAVVSPAATGLYGFYFLGPLAAVLGLVALPLAMIHGEPGYDLAIRLGLVQPRSTVEGAPGVYVEILNGLIWAVVYGSMGWLVDRLRSRKKARDPLPDAA
jgi:hypothetical protein